MLLAGLVMAVTQAVLGLTASVIIAAVMLFASSAAWALFNLTVVTMRQRQVPAALLGPSAADEPIGQVLGHWEPRWEPSGRTTFWDSEWA